MAEVTVELRPEHAEYDPGIAFPQLRRVDGVNFAFATLMYDAAVPESCFFFFRAARYGSGDLSIDFEWIAEFATMGQVVWGAALGAVTPDADAGALNLKALAAAQTVIDVHLGTNEKRLHRATLTLSNLDGLAEDDYVVLKIFRDATSGSDTLIGDAGLCKVAVRYSDAT